MIEGPRRWLKRLEPWIPVLPRMLAEYRCAVMESCFLDARRGEPSLVELGFLGDLAATLKGPGPIVEIGTLFGRSTSVLALRKDPGRELITVDDYSWNPLGIDAGTHRRIASHVLAEAEEKLNTQLVSMEKSRFYASYDGPPPALVFFDANHTCEETRQDLVWARRVAAHVICGHDYKPEYPGVIRAVDEMGGPRQLRESLWVLGD